jgi:tungstate transport system ATP-binding protein
MKFCYKEGFTLDIPSLAIKEGDSIGFVGPNGSGKTTLLKILAFLEFGYNGRLVFKGRTITEQSGTLRQRVTYLLQDPYLLRRSVFENVAYGVKIRGDRYGLKNRVFEALRWVGLDPRTFSSRRWNELSGGEAKRVALASRFVIKPEVLILDEPTANVDRKSAMGIRKAIERIRAEGELSLIIASHDYVWLHDITGQVLQISGGRIIGAGSDNIIHGPWIIHQKDLYRKKLPDGQWIYGVYPPQENSVAVLKPSNIIVSQRKPQDMSAQNILNGVITHMWEDSASEIVRVEVDVSGTMFICLITHYAAEDLKLLPGKEVWIVFKASSLLWQ